MKHKILVIIILMGISLSVSSISAASTITAFATAGGTISPSGKLTVDAGALQKFQINASSGYLISEVIVDDVSVGAISSYTFNDVSEDHSIYAIFQLDVTACESLIKQDFNDGQVPPSGWQLLTTNQNYTWKPLLLGNGDYTAAVDYDKVNHQDEFLLSQQLSVKEAILHFESTGDIFWCRDTFDNCDLEIWIVVGTWDRGIGDDIFLGTADDDWIEGYYFAASSFNLTSILPNKPIRIGFRYKGSNGNLILLDDVQICSDKPSTTFLPFLHLLLE